MSDPVFPATLLAVGQQDPEFGGQPATRWDGEVLAYQDACIQELQRQAIWKVWTPYEQRKLRVKSSGVAGDFLFHYLAGSGNYPLHTIASLTALSVSYDPDLTPRAVMLAEACSADTDALCIFWGPGIPSSIHGLGSGASGKVRINVTSGRLERADGTVGEILVGTITAAGYVWLDYKTASVE